MSRRIPRDQFLAWLSQFYDFAASPACYGASLVASFKETFGVGHDDPDLATITDDQDLLDQIEERYVQPSH